MDSQVALALMRKAQLTFELDGNVMSFPMTPHVYTADDLAFVRPDVNATQFLVFREFSDLVDQIPRGPLLDTSSEERLSSFYKGLLGGGGVQLAASSRSPDEEAQYQSAASVLYVTAADGSRTSTHTMEAYRQYRDAWFSLRLEINSRRIDAEFSTDPETVRRWKEVEEPALSQRLSDLERDWSAKGFRAQVESALQTTEILGAKSPALQWDAWRKRCLEEVDRPTDPVTNQTFWPSAFSPSNVLGIGGWIQFELEGSAVQSLAASAPSSLRGRWDDQVDLDIDRLTFECTTVRVERSWFTSDVFGARFWRLPGASVSTGTSLSSGLCPAYVAAVVLARRVAVTLRPQSSRNSGALEKFKAASFLPLGTLQLTPTVKSVLGRDVLTHTVPSVTVRSASAISTATVRRATPVAAVGRVRVATAQPVVVRPATTVSTSALSRVMRPTFATKLRPTAPAPTGPTLDPGVHILGLICKTVPACPNPDPSLGWNS